ncbi:MAG: transposase [Oligoflexia bacterium]|nr:transposase [Oligoflexia bacterium]
MIIYFTYNPSRSGETASSLLEGYTGYLQVDGCDSYNHPCKNNKIIRIGCWITFVANL